MTILVDINVLLDVFQRRQPFYVHSLAMMIEEKINYQKKVALEAICKSKIFTMEDSL